MMRELADKGTPTFVAELAVELQMNRPGVRRVPPVSVPATVRGVPLIFVHNRTVLYKESIDTDSGPTII